MRDGAVDYIVVGAGSAGCVIAARLSEDPSVRVLLLEAGRSDEHFFGPMPIAFPRIANDRRYVWPLESEPEPGLDGRRLPAWRGKVLGGCSSINAMINVRGHPNDFDDWAARGLPGWDYASVLPYFKRLEASWRGENEWHGVAGSAGAGAGAAPARNPHLDPSPSPLISTMPRRERTEGIVGCTAM